jgi:hypothetical protein
MRKNNLAYATRRAAVRVFYVVTWCLGVTLLNMSDDLGLMLIGALVALTSGLLFAVSVLR